MKQRSHRSSKAFWPKAYRDFCERLLAARAEAGLTQREAAAKLGRTHHFIAKSESGERRVDVIELIQFAKLYKKPIYYFLPQNW